MGWRSKVGRLLGLGLMAAVLLRVSFVRFERTDFSPLSVSAHFALRHSHQLPPAAQVVVEKFLTGLAMPAEIAAEQGILPKPKTKPTPKKKSPVTIEDKARDWVLKQKKSRKSADFVDENAFIVSGALISLFSMLLSGLFPYEGFQHTLLGLACFWFGANGAHGEKAAFPVEFWGLGAVIVLALFFLAEKDEVAVKDQVDKKDKKAKKAKEEEDEWDDGFGNETMEDVRKRGGFKGGCCDSGSCS